MTTALDTVRESELTVLPPKQRASSTAIAMLQEHNELMEMAYGLASKMVQTQFVPTRFRGKDKAEDATAAILYGMELGLNPIQSLQRVIPIHGQPSLEARTMVALLQAKGYKVKTRAQSDTAVTVWGKDLDGEEYETTWTIERAMKAGYVPRPSSPDSQCRPDVDDDWVTVTKTWDGKTKKSVVGNMKYITDPQAMLKAKAQAEVCREIAPEVLLGIGYSREDLESERWDDDDFGPRTVQSTRGDAINIGTILAAEESAPTSSGLGSKIQPPKEPQRAEAEPEPEPAAEDKPARKRASRAKSKTTPAADADAGEAGPGQDGENDQGQGAEPSSGANTPSDPGDQEPAAPATESKPKTAMRKAVENRLFTLFNGVPAQIGDGVKVTREERLAVYRQVIGRDDINSTDDLENHEVAAVCDQLFTWGQENKLADEFNEIRNAIAIAQAAGGQ
uniref:RecT-like DNA pairing protein n=1 Tax=Mycobacterium phage Farewell TaxID=3158893 RepID=A0AAU8GQ35_9CAUD